VSAARSYLLDFLAAGGTVATIAAPAAYAPSLLTVEGITEAMLIEPRIDRPGLLVITDTSGVETVATLPAEVP